MVNLINLLKRFLLTIIEIYKSKFYRKSILHIVTIFVLLLLVFLQLESTPPQKEIFKTLNNFLYNTVDSIIYNNMGFNDSNVKRFIQLTTNSFGFFLSLLSAIYIFTHREQKTVSPSASHNRYKNHLVLRVIFVILFIIITGYILQDNYNNYSREFDSNTMHITNVFQRKIYVWFVSLIIGIIHIMQLIKYLLNSMSVAKMLDSSINDTSSTIVNLITIIRIERFNVTFFYIRLVPLLISMQGVLNNSYDRLHFNIESVFQNLKFTANHNMNKEFENSIQNLQSKVINTLMKDKTSEGKSYTLYLYEKDQEQFVELYKSFLRNILSLINYLYKEKHYNKARDLISLYFSLYVKGDDVLGRYFMESLNEFLSSLDTNDSRQLRAFLDELENIITEQTLSTYHNLLIKLIIQNNVKVLTNVVYDFKNIIDINLEEANKYQSNKFSHLIALRQNKSLERQVVYILMQCLLKSIEISHYSSAGFLVKYLITNFDSKVINYSFSLLKGNPNLFADNQEKKDNISNQYELSKKNIINSEAAASVEKTDINQESEDQRSDQIKPFNMNKETFDYCSKKLLILLYGQQYYAYNNNLWFINKEKPNQEIDINIEFENCSYSRYILKKVEAASSHYGLIFFNDKDTMKKIYSKCNVDNKQKIGFIG